MSAQFAYDYRFEPIGSTAAPVLEPNINPGKKPEARPGPELRRLKKRGHADRRGRERAGELHPLQDLQQRGHQLPGAGKGRHLYRVGMRAEQ